MCVYMCICIKWLNTLWRGILLLSRNQTWVKMSKFGFGVQQNVVGVVSFQEVCSILWSDANMTVWVFIFMYDCIFYYLSVFGSQRQHVRKTQTFLSKEPDVFPDQEDIVPPESSGSAPGSEVQLVTLFSCLDPGSSFFEHDPNLMTTAPSS